MWVWYRGAAFHGFQWQHAQPTVQSALEAALEPFGVTTRPTPAARTDRGVSARMQVVMVKAPELLDASSIQLGPGAGVALIRAAHEKFQPQWSAIGKEYRYRLPPDTDAAALQTALSEAVGTHDFAALHGKSSSTKPRTIHRAEVRRRHDGSVEVQVEGDSFGRFQVRLLVGTALEVATGALTMDAWHRAITRRERISGVRAAPEPLVLWSVRYPDALDPFSEKERRDAPGVPRSAPFED